LGFANLQFAFRNLQFHKLQQQEGVRRLFRTGSQAMHGVLEALTFVLPGLAALCGLILASAFFSGSETALFYLSRDELRMLQVGKPRERVIADLLRDPDRLLTAVLFWNLLTNLTYFASSVVIARQLAERHGAALAGAFSAVAVAAIILFGEVFPKSLAVVFHRRIAGLVSWPVAIAVRLLDPVFPVLGMITRIIRRTIWPHVRPEPYLQADDLEKAVATSQLSAETILHEQQILRRILELSEITAEEVMRPRGTYATYAPGLRVSELHATAPVVDYLLLQDPTVAKTDADAIGSAVPLSTLCNFTDENVAGQAEPIVHVPWCASLADVLQTLRNRLCDVAVVVNEYGETTGVVTYEDVMDTVLVPIPSRAKRILRRDPVLQVAEGRYHVDGLTTLRHLSQRLGFEYEPTADGLLTVAGMLHEQFERIPQVGDECVWAGYQFKVIETTERGKLRVMVSPLSVEP
jgi:Mg2+/Co2+ transporter CorB